MFFIFCPAVTEMIQESFLLILFLNIHTDLVKKKKAITFLIYRKKRREADTRNKRGYNSIICKKVITPKTYKNEKTENYNSDEGERKKTIKSAK